MSTYDIQGGIFSGLKVSLFFKRNKVEKLKKNVTKINIILSNALFLSHSLNHPVTPQIYHGTPCGLKHAK